MSADSPERKATGTAYEHAELEQINCRHCGNPLQAITTQIVGYIGANGSFFCDPKNPEVFHEPEIN
jgi:hypothetical protein